MKKRTLMSVIGLLLSLAIILANCGGGGGGGISPAPYAPGSTPGGNQPAGIVSGPAGSLVQSFGVNGKTTVPVGISNGEIRALRVQTDGKLIALGKILYTGSTVGSHFVLAKYNTDYYSLDTTFNPNNHKPGIAAYYYTEVIQQFGGNYAEATCMDLQSDGRIVVAGYTMQNNYAGSAFVLRFNTDGTLDTSFNSTGSMPGVAGVTLPGIDMTIKSLAVQNDQKIVLIGGSRGFNGGQSGKFIIIRFNQDGTLDATFNSGGTTPGVVAETCPALVTAGGSFGGIQPGTGGKIVVVGYSVGSVPADFVAARFNPDGSLDTSLNSTTANPGYSIVSGISWIVGMAMGARGELAVLVGSSTGYSWSVMIFTNGLKLSKTVGLPSYSTIKSAPYGIAYQGTNILVGAANEQGYAIVARVTSSGSFDTSVGSSGCVGLGLNLPSKAIAFAVRQDKVIVGGSMRLGNLNLPLGSGYETLWGLLLTVQNYSNLLRVGNHRNTSVGETIGGLNAMAVQPDGKIVVGGWGSEYQIGPNIAEYAAVARFNADGSIDSGFYNSRFYDSARTIVPYLHSSLRLSTINDLKINNDGTIYAVGKQWGGNLYYLFDATYASNGADKSCCGWDNDNRINNSYDAGFVAMTENAGNILYYHGSSVSRRAGMTKGGVEVRECLNPISAYYYPYDVTQDQNNGSVIVTGSCLSQTLRRQVLMVYGDMKQSLDFDTTLSLGNDTETRGRAVALQSDGKIVVGGYTKTASNGYDFILARFNGDDGTLDKTFNSSGPKPGAVVTSIGPGDDQAYAVAIQANGKIVLAGTSNNGTDYDFALVRYNSDGSVDTDFGDNGIVTENMGVWSLSDREYVTNDSISAIEILADGKILVAGNADGRFALAQFWP